jgi:hypothetical protein
LQSIHKTQFTRNRYYFCFIFETKKLHACKQNQHGQPPKGSGLFTTPILDKQATEMGGVVERPFSDNDPFYKKAVLRYPPEMISKLFQLRTTLQDELKNYSNLILSQLRTHRDFKIGFQNQTKKLSPRNFGVKFSIHKWNES